MFPWHMNKSFKHINFYFGLPMVNFKTSKQRLPPEQNLLLLHLICRWIPSVYSIWINPIYSSILLLLIIGLLLVLDYWWTSLYTVLIQGKRNSFSSNFICCGSKKKSFKFKFPFKLIIYRGINILIVVFQQLLLNTYSLLSSV